MNQENNFKTFCPRCGNEMNSNYRYCMKCGYLNPTNQANQGMNKFISKNENEIYQIGSGQTIIQNNNNQITTSIATNTGNKLLCFLFNYLIYIGVIIVSFALIIGNKVIDFNSIKNSLLPDTVLVTSIIFLYIYPIQLIFTKCNKKWWYALIPFYNLFVLSDIVYRKKWLGILLLIPVVGQIFLIIVFYKLATRFKYSGLLAVLFPIIFIPLMGFGSRLYDGVSYVSEDRTLEKDYKMKKLFFITLMILLVLSGILVFWNNIIEIKTKATRVTNYYYVFATNQIVDKTKQLARENYLDCEEYRYNSTSGKYYIWYSDLGDATYLPFHAYRDIISGYVIIDNTDGISKYYVSISDGVFGYPETLYDDISLETIIPYSEVKERKDINICKSTKQKITVGGTI